MKSFNLKVGNKFQGVNSSTKVYYLFIVALLFYFIFSFSNGFSQTKWEFHPDNPVIELGVSGSWDDYWLETMSIVYDGENYRMWYYGVDSKYNSGIGYAVSTDGINWEKSNENPILTRGADGTWDDAAIFGGTVILIENTFYLWFNGGNKTGTSYGIGLATSSDGINWKEHENNPVFKPVNLGDWDNYDSGLYPSVLFDGELYYMWYGGCRNEFKQPGSGRYLMRIGYATSPNGIEWTPYENNPVLKEGAKNSDWDYWKVEMPTVIKNHTGYHIWFHGDNAKSQIGYAHSNDGINWTKYEKNPVLSPQLIGNWSLIGLMRPVALYDENEHTYKLWCMGGAVVGATITSQIGYATSPEDTASSLIQNRSNMSMPDRFVLYQNYPNPFNSVTTIQYQLPQSERATLTIYNMLGQKIRTLIDQTQQAGHSFVSWDGKDSAGRLVPSGVYFYRLENENFSEVKKMLLLQ